MSKSLACGGCKEDDPQKCQAGIETCLVQHDLQSEVRDIEHIFKSVSGPRVICPVSVVELRCRYGRESAPRDNGLSTFQDAGGGHVTAGRTQTVQQASRPDAACKALRAEKNASSLQGQISGDCMATQRRLQESRDTGLWPHGIFTISC